MEDLEPRGDWVTIVEYMHKHGNDFGVFDDDESAQVWIKELIRQSVDEFSNEDQERVHRALVDGDYESVWNELTDESFNTHGLPVLKRAPTGLQKMEESIEDPNNG
jgi:hypothetical protein